MKGIFFYLLTLITLVNQAQTVIHVYAPSYVGKYAILNTPADYVTLTNKRLDKQLIDSTGKLTFVVNISESIKAFIDIGSSSGIIYIDKNTKEYHVFFPKKEDRRQQFVTLEFAKLPKNDLNTLILEFNYRLDNLLYGDSTKLVHLMHQDDTFKDSINAFKQTLIKEYRPIKNKYFHEYIKYSIASVEQLYTARGMLKNKIYLHSMYIENHPILYYNDAYMAFFKQNYEDFFSTNIGLVDKIKHAIENYESFEKLDEVIVNHPFMKNDTIRELVIIENLYDAYFKKQYNFYSIEAIFNQILKNTLIPEHQTIVKNIIAEINRLKIGAKAPDFELITNKNDTISLDSLKGKYVYIQFFSSGNQRALQEMKIMQEMQKKYGKYIQFLSISVDEYEADFKNFIDRNYKYKWVFAHYRGDNDLLQNYAIKSVPTYILIDERGNMVEPYALSPTPNYPQPSIDKTFFYIKKEKEPKNNRRIGSKQN